MADKMALKKIKISPAPAPIPEGLSALPTSVLIWQKNTGDLWANPYFEKEFGKVANKNFASNARLHLIHERPITLDLLSLIGRHEGFMLENREGVAKPVELKVNALGDPSDETFLILIDEVEEKAHLEEQLIENHLQIQKAYEQLRTTQDALIQTAKLASLGELSTGIAHELNQPLQAIMGFSQELQHSENLSGQDAEFLGDIVSASKKMAQIINSLRSFARNATTTIEEISVEHAIHEAVHLMRHQLHVKGIKIEIAIEPNIPYVLANAIQLEQVLINLIANARDAIESSKKQDRKILVRALTLKNEILVEVEDNGSGMDEKTKTKLFDPFFTTKEVGKGTGLGLSISYGILKQFNADIKVKSKLGEGSTFTVIFNPKEKKI